jgi:hypothetical protein
MNPIYAQCKNCEFGTGPTARIDKPPVSHLRASGIAKVLDGADRGDQAGFTEETDVGKDQGRLGIYPLSDSHYILQRQ